MKTVSDFFVHDGSFVRLRNVTLGYTLPSKLTDYLKINRVRFYVSAENLLTYTKYDGYDPKLVAVYLATVSIREFIHKRVPYLEV